MTILIQLKWALQQRMCASQSGVLIYYTISDRLITIEQPRELVFMGRTASTTLLKIIRTPKEKVHIFFLQQGL